MLDLSSLPSYSYDTARHLAKLHGDSTVLDLNALKDPKLSVVAKAIIVHIDNLPDNADISLKAIQKGLSGKFLKGAIKAGYRELLREGYLAEIDD